MKKYILGISLTASLAMANASHAETLAEIYQQAQQNDHQFRAAQATLQAAQETKTSGRAGLLPEINGAASWQKQNTSVSGGSAGSSDTDSTVNVYSIELTQPLFNMNAWHTYQSAKATTNKAEVEFKIAEEDLITRVAQTYFDALQAVENFNTSKAEETALKQQLERAKQRLEVGLIAITEVHEAQAAFDSARAERISAEGAVDIAFDALEVLTGHYYRQLSPLKADFPVSPPQPAERKQWLDMTQSNNLTLRAAELTSKIERKNLKAAKANHYPTLDGTLSYTTFNGDSVANGTFTQDTTTEENVISVTLTVPIYNGGSVSSARRAAGQQAIIARENYLQTQRNVMQNTRSLHLTLITGVATVNARKQAIISNQSALEATQAGYEVGTRDLLDVLTAQRNLYSAQRDHVTALYDYVINSLELKASAGILSAKDIVELSAWLESNTPVYRNLIDTDVIPDTRAIK